jgi:rhodanese-related sulfurtransferase
MTYAGDLTPLDAHALLLERPNAVLVDCRTKAEWSFVGVPAITGTRFIEWTTWPDGSRNPEFVAAAGEGVDPDQPVLMLCRSGGRSAAAAHALTAEGFTEVYNVLEGFEGDVDAAGHRAGGWRGAGLPWQQG